MAVYGKGINLRDWLHVEDHYKAILKVLIEGIIGEIYKIEGDSEIVNIGLVEKLLIIFHSEYHIIIKIIID